MRVRLLGFLRGILVLLDGDAQRVIAGVVYRGAGFTIGVKTAHLHDVCSLAKAMRNPFGLSVAARVRLIDELSIGAVQEDVEIIGVWIITPSAACNIHADRGRAA